MNRGAATAHQNQRRMQRAASAPWTPAALGASVQRWYDALASFGGANDGDLLTSALDLSPAGVNAAAAAATRPTFKAAAWTGGLPCWRTIGGANYWTAGSIAQTSFCNLVIGKCSNAGVMYEHAPDLIGDTDGSWIYTSNGGPSLYCKRGGVAEGWDAAAGWASSSLPVLACVTYDGTHAGHLLYANSLTPSTLSSSGGAGDPGAASSGARSLGICANTGGTRGVNGDWFAAIFVSPKPSDADVARLISYYAARAGIVLS